MSLLPATVQISDLFEVVWVSLLAGVSVTVAFSFVVYSSARSAEARRQGRSAAASAHGALAIVMLIAFLAVVAYGVHIILSKR